MGTAASQPIPSDFQPLRRYLVWTEQWRIIDNLLFLSVAIVFRLNAVLASKEQVVPAFAEVPIDTIDEFRPYV